MRKVFFSKKALRLYIHEVEEKNVDQNHGVGFEYYRFLPFLPIYILTNVYVDHFKD